MTAYQELIVQADHSAQQGRSKEAIALYEQAIEAEPEQVSAYYNLALLVHSQGDAEKALHYFQKTAELCPQDPSIFNNLGVLYFSKGMLEEAESHFKKAAERAPRYLEALYGLGRAYLNQGRIYDAMIAFNRCLEIAPHKEKVRALLKECEGKKDLEEVKAKYKKILIVMDEGIGNMVMLTPTIQAIMKRLPGSEITILGRQPSVQLIEGWEAVGKVLTEPDEDEYDIGFLSIWSGNYETRYGERIKGQCRALYKMRVDNIDLHEAYHHLKIARLLGYEGGVSDPFCMTKEVDLDLPSGGKIAGLSDTTLNTGAWERKRWPYYRELARELIRRGYTVLLIGGKGEAERFRKEDWPPEVVNGLGKYDVRETAGLIKKCDLFIGNDSGPAHIAGALGVKTYIVFGATRITKNKPLGSYVTVITKHLSCSPCQYTERWDLCKHWRCMSEITVEEVLNAVLDKPAPESRSLKIRGVAQDKLSLVGKDYSACKLTKEDNLMFIVRNGVKERLRFHLVGAGRANFPWGMENEILRALELDGIEVIDTDYRLDRANFTERFLRVAHLMLVCKGSGIPPELIKRFPGRTILWYQDDVFTTQHAPRDLALNGHGFDTVYSFDKCALDEYRKYGIRDVRWLPLAMSPAVHRKGYLPKKYDVSFVGTLFPNRKRLIECLQKRFDVFVAQAYMDDMVRIFNESKIVLNLGVGPTGIQSRVFEALGCGAFLLTNEIPEDSRLFEDRKHLVYFSEENIEELIEYYLAHEEEREEIALNGYIELNAKHTYDHRVHQILSDCGLRMTPSPIHCSRRGEGESPPLPLPLSPHWGGGRKGDRRRLIVFWHGIGDNVMAIPALRAFRRKHPNDHIGYMYLNRIHKDGLMEGCPYLDALYTCSDAWDDYPDYETGVRAVIEEAKEIARREGYDEVLPITMRACSLDHHRIYRIAYELGVELDGWEAELPIPDEERRRAEDVFREWGIGEEDFIVAIHRRGANVHKYWEIGEGRKFVDYMREKYHTKFIVFETHTDLDRESGKQFQGEQIFSTLDIPDVSLKLSAALIDKCDLFVGIDSGPMWLATTTKTPIIALFTMTWMHQSAPMREGSTIVCSQKAWDMATSKFKEENRNRILREQPPAGYQPAGGSISAEKVIEAAERFSLRGLPQKEVKGERESPPHPLSPSPHRGGGQKGVPAFLHQLGSYWAAFLTLKCSADCPYCIQKIDRESFERARRVPSLSGEEWVRILNALEHRPNQPLAVIGGEPSIHPDFLYILNHLEGYSVTVTTNFISPIFKHVDGLAEELRPKCPIRFNTSFHPGFISADDFTERVKRMKELGLWVDQIAMVDHPGSNFEKVHREFARRGVSLRPQSFLGPWEGKLYPNHEDQSVVNDPKEHGITDFERYKEGFSAKHRSPMLCRTARFLIAPDGRVYPCHHHLYSRRNPVGDLIKGELSPSEGFFRCEDFGFCNPCDYPHVEFRRIDEEGGSDQYATPGISGNRRKGRGMFSDRWLSF